MHLEMAAFRPAAEACDVHVAIESPAKSAIKSTFAIFMFPLLGRMSASSLIPETRAKLYPSRYVTSYVFSAAILIK
jgi:hypothetical protein